MSKLVDILGWISTVIAISASILLAVGPSYLVHGLAFFVVSSALLFVVAVHNRITSLAVLQVVYIVIDLIGIWRNV